MRMVAAVAAAVAAVVEPSRSLSLLPLPGATCGTLRGASVRDVPLASRSLPLPGWATDEAGSDDAAAAAHDDTSGTARRRSIGRRCRQREAEEAAPPPAIVRVAVESLSLSLPFVLLGVRRVRAYALACERGLGCEQGSSGSRSGAARGRAQRVAEESVVGRREVDARCCCSCFQV